jgi:hypothetical protein
MEKRIALGLLLVVLLVGCAPVRSGVIIEIGYREGYFDLLPSVSVYIDKTGFHETSHVLRRYADTYYAVLLDGEREVTVYHTDNKWETLTLGQFYVIAEDDSLEHPYADRR